MISAGRCSDSYWDGSHGPRRETHPIPSSTVATNSSPRYVPQLTVCDNSAAHGFLSPMSRVASVQTATHTRTAGCAHDGGDIEDGRCRRRALNAPSRVQKSQIIGICQQTVLNLESSFPRKDKHVPPLLAVRQVPILQLGPSSGSILRFRTWRSTFRSPDLDASTPCIAVAPDYPIGQLPADTEGRV